MVSLEERIAVRKALRKPIKPSFKEKLKTSFFRGSRKIGRGIGTGIKTTGRFAVKEVGQAFKERRKIVKQERLKAFRRRVERKLATPSKRQIQPRQIQPQPIPQQFPNLIGINDNNKKKQNNFF